ncbi:hypothetical protein LSAT2_029431 [Lamellibrachia satsuma]|nr:hypothetical protein LSAT2_029431 [Lamellibrachia satsuma]
MDIPTRSGLVAAGLLEMPLGVSAKHHNLSELTSRTKLAINMPEIRCPGYPNCKRHFKYIMGMKGHALACEFAAKHLLKRPPSQPGYRLGPTVAEQVVFKENHEIGNDKICRKNIIVYTPECMLQSRFL